VDIVLMIHSLVRWLVLVVAAAAIVKFAIGWLRGGRYDGMDRGLSAGFAGLMDLQMLLGLVMLFGQGFFGELGFPRYRIEHTVMMVLAVVVGHLPRRWKNAPAAVRHRNSLICILVALALVIAGIAVLPGGLSR
jgi:hypothetical protein